MGASLLQILEEIKLRSSVSAGQSHVRRIHKSLAWESFCPLEAELSRHPMLLVVSERSVLEKCSTGHQ